MAGWKPDAAARVAMLYAVFGGAWILLTDRLVGRLTSDPATAGLLQTLKGWVFVLLSAALVYWLVRRARRRWHSAHETLKRSEERSARAERIADLGHWELALRTGELHWSDQVFRIFGVTPGEFGASYEAFLSFVHPDDRGRMEEAQQEVLDGDARLDLEHRIVRPDGEVRHVRERGALGHDADGEPVRLTGTVQDITEQKELQDALQRSRDLLQRYAEHLTRAREQERADIAREIHDELGQALTGLKMQLSQIRRRLGAGEEEVPSSALDPSLELIQSTVAQVRELSSSLRPTALDQLGLREGLEWLAEKVEDRTGLEVSYEVGDVELELGEEASIHVYRVVQEALTNVARHAEAERVRILVAAEEGDLLVRVLDDGVGLDEASVPSLDSHGLLGMQERAHMLGGELELRDREEGGAEVRLRVPRPEGKVA